MKEIFKFVMCLERHDATREVGDSLLSSNGPAKMKKQSKIQKAIQWFIYSSQNPREFALTIKSILAVLVLWGVDSTLSDELANGIVDFYVALGSLFSTALVIFGLGRKIWYSLK